MAFIPPTIDQFKGQFFRDFPFAVPAYGAQAVASIGGGAVVAVTLLNTGFDYSVAPTVTIAAPVSGVQATATALYDNGVITGFTIVLAGSGYTSAPEVVITPAQGDGDDTQTDKVQNRDITAAIETAAFNINQGLARTQSQYTKIYNLLAAHYLVTNIFNSSLGLGGATAGDWVRQAMNVADLGQTLGIPDRVMKSPLLSLLSKSTYGLQYLSIVAPQLVGNARAVCRP